MDITKTKDGNLEIETEYKKSINIAIAEYIEAVLDGSVTASFKLDGVSAKEVADIKELTGLDVLGYARILTPDSVRHIKKRHGESGLADSSMADILDIARMEYVLEHYDSIELLDKKAQGIMNSNNTRAIIIRYIKRVNGNYYVAQAVPDSNRRTLVILSAYKSKAV